MFIKISCDFDYMSFEVRKTVFLHTRPEFLWTRPGLGNVVLHKGCKTTLVHDVRMTILTSFLTSWRQFDFVFHQTFQRQRLKIGTEQNISWSKNVVIWA